MNIAFVWMRGVDDVIRLVGQLGATDPSAQSGRFKCEFEYAASWADAESFPLDPQSLPLKTTSRRFSADQFHPPLAVFEDALPDEWGRSLLRTALRQAGREPSLMEMLLRMQGGGTGALIFTETVEPPQPAATARSAALSDLLDAAEQFEAGNLTAGHEFQKLLEGSSRAGGARPKALVHDDTDEWLVKFPSQTRDEAHDVVGLEATCLTLARRAGLDVPQSRLQTIGRRRVLMVRRFDVTAENGRRHMISLSALCRERPGIYAHDYSAVAQMLRRHSAAPAEDVAAIFRQMVFNAAVGNVDDHLKNFWMLGTHKGYRLSPAFDLVPDITGRGTHALSFRSASHCPEHPELVELGNDWGVAEPETIIDQVVKAASGFSATARKLAVQGGRTLERVAADVRKRVRIIAGDSSL